MRYNPGVTLIAVESAAAVEGGTDALTRGEELVIDYPGYQSLRGGKGGVYAKRKASGQSCSVADGMVVAPFGFSVAPTPEKLKISYSGAEVKDTDVL